MRKNIDVNQGRRHANYGASDYRAAPGGVPAPRGMHHAVLPVRLDGRWLVLDNATARILAIEDAGAGDFCVNRRRTIRTG